MHLLTLIWLFLLIPQVTYLHTKKMKAVWGGGGVGEGGLEIFISNFAPLSQRIALKTVKI